MLFALPCRKLRNLILAPLPPCWPHGEERTLLAQRLDLGRLRAWARPLSPVPSCGAFSLTDEGHPFRGVSTVQVCGLHVGWQGRVESTQVRGRHRREGHCLSCGCPVCQCPGVGVQWLWYLTEGAPGLLTIGHLIANWPTSKET